MKKSFFLILLLLVTACVNSQKIADPTNGSTDVTAGSTAPTVSDLVFPNDNPWNQDISSEAVDPASTILINSLSLSATFIHPAFGTVWNGAPNGMPYVVVSGNQPKVPVSFDYWNESDPSHPPMGMRVKLKSSFDIAGFPANVQVILRALKKYGMILADTGPSWMISGAPNDNWSDQELHNL